MPSEKHTSCWCMPLVITALRRFLSSHWAVAFSPNPQSWPDGCRLSWLKVKEFPTFTDVRRNIAKCLPLACPTMLVTMLVSFLDPLPVPGAGGERRESVDCHRRPWH